jgi:uroporphyrin-III C-methyltransferase
MSVLDEPLYFSSVPTREPAPRAARVTLVGAGPGDPELLTVRAERALRRARLVLYDHLVPPEILALARQAELVCVGKESGDHTLPQAELCALMVRLARSGRALVRLKGGDPYIFGRGGEEAQALAAAGVPFEVVPGISAAQAAAAEAGMPLTHRDHAAAVVLATGHRRGDQGMLDMDWAALARPRQTVVIYMGVSTLEPICAQLAAHGLAEDTPAALVERASRAGSRRVVGTLRTLPALALQHEVRSPALLIVGGVVTLHEVLAAQGVASTHSKTYA